MKGVFFFMKKLTQEDFIERAATLHEGKYSYDKVVYVNSAIKVVLVCPIHGDFSLTPDNHLYRQSGCMKCAVEHRANLKIRKKGESFALRAAKKHGNKYDYSLVEYTGIYNKVKIICPKHGVFELAPYSHLRGNGCGACSGKKKTLESFIQESKDKYGERFDYTYTTSYSGDSETVDLVCNIHNLRFTTKAGEHLRSTYGGCKECHADSMRLTVEEFMERAEAIHPGEYDYSMVEYTSGKVPIACPTHGVFYQNPFNHLNGQRCPRCATTVSKPHALLLGTFSGCEVNVRDVLPSGRELDIWFPEARVAVEIDGVYFHSEKFKTDKYYHRDKHEEAEKLGIRLLQFWDYEVLEKTDLVVDMIKHALGSFNGTKIFARKTELRELGSKEYSKFMEENHLQGAISSKFKWGLFYGGELVCALGVSKRRGENVIDRFATKVGYQVVGGFSKLLKQAPLPLITHSATRYSEGKLYESMGFQLLRKNDVGLYYTDGKKLYSRNVFQKHKLVSMSGYDQNKTANQILAENDIHPIWSSGTKTWVKEPTSLFGCP